jgi:ABC-type uncharacterized transport system permease subunit
MTEKEQALHDILDSVSAILATLGTAAFITWVSGYAPHGHDFTFMQRFCGILTLRFILSACAGFPNAKKDS